MGFLEAVLVAEVVVVGEAILTSEIAADGGRRMTVLGSERETGRHQ